MLIVPELKKVFILVPRTGSGTFYREMRRVYPKSMLLYRHMEADGCPRGYDRWERIGFVRHPLARLWSLYNFMRDFGGGAQVQGGGASADAQRARKQVDRPFEDWLLNNREPWTVPYDMNGKGDYWPVLSRNNPSPENLLSQFQYLRPDLGTMILKFEDLKIHMGFLGLNPDAVSNATAAISGPRPLLSEAAHKHTANYYHWDLAQGCKDV